MKVSVQITIFVFSERIETLNYLQVDMNFRYEAFYLAVKPQSGQKFTANDPGSTVGIYFWFW